MDYLLSEQQLNSLIDQIVEETKLTNYDSEFTRSYSYFYCDMIKYFLYCYYGATYGSIDYRFRSEFRDTSKYPKFLVDAQILKLNKYQPQLIIHKHKNKLLDNSQYNNIFLFCKDIVVDISKVNSFGLMNRVVEDKTFSTTLLGKYVNKIKLLREYKESKI